jgi:hypothetical protein
MSRGLANFNDSYIFLTLSVYKTITKTKLWRLVILVLE